MIRVPTLDDLGSEDRSSEHLALLGRKLSRHARLSPSEHQALARWLGRSLRTVREGVPLIERGAAPAEINIVIDGWAARYRVAPNGRRQILAFHLPGDVCEFNAFVMRTMDSTIVALTRLQVACISRTALNELTAEHPKLAQGLWWESQLASSVAREWTVSVGHRNARQRVAHLLCEMSIRLEQVGLGDGLVAALPLTQVDIGDACAMTAEHTNRTLRELWEAGLIVLARGQLTITDWAGLAALARFDRAYLEDAA